MVDEVFFDADGELLIVPQLGRLRVVTELGVLEVEPREIVAIPRGMRFRVELLDGEARGYVCENYGAPFRLPDLGPIGANGLANARDFLTPVAVYEDREGPATLYVKWGGTLWQAEVSQSPLDVVAWHGNYAPYKYDMRRFSPVGPVLFDHADPSIFTVLTSPSETPGTANVDFVCFPERWMVAEDTFRPPWYHMNVMSEFMGLVHGVYDAKTGGGFVPGATILLGMPGDQAAHVIATDGMAPVIHQPGEDGAVGLVTRQVDEQTQQQHSSPQGPYWPAPWPRSQPLPGMSPGSGWSAPSSRA